MKLLTVEEGTTTASFAATVTETGFLPTYVLGSGISEVTIDNSEPFTAAKMVDGARVMFFVADNKTFPSAPEITYTGFGGGVMAPTSPANPVYPPYSFSEITLKDLSYGFVIDVQTVDGFVFPMTITLNGGLGEVGQRLGPDEVVRGDVLNAYSPFISKLKSEGGLDYLPMKYTANGGGLLNPFYYISAANAQNEFQNLDSQLHTVFDDAVETLFANENLSIQGVSSGAIAADIYNVTGTGGQAYPGSPFNLPALQFTGQSYSNVFTVFKPTGICVLSYADSRGAVHPITGTINNASLTFETPLPGDTPLEGCSSAGLAPSRSGAAATR